MVMQQTIKDDLTPEQTLKVIFSYAAKIASEKQLDRLLMLMADMGRELISADRCTLWILDQKNNELWTRVAHGVDEIRVPAQKGVVGYSVQNHAPVYIDDAYQDPRFNQEVDRQTGYRTKSIICIPFENSEGQIMGAYQAINKRTSSGVFTQKDLEYLTLAASYTGKSLEAAMLSNEIEETQKEIIFSMGEIGETRSKETGNHVKRVAEYSYLLARHIGMSDEEAELLRIVSPMHDIGKVAIPDSVLNKAGKLTDEEYDIMKRHTIIGYNLLKNSHRHIMRAAAVVAHEHHEKWNGTGYPRGIAGDDIHIYARITAVADVFDALGSERVYKPAWQLDRILDFFQEESGRHFDPVLVDAFLENLDEFLMIRDSYRDL
ncbi:HD domain-containing phosphohydrolase [Brevibacillus dissolubilis]|uniref:HD domain-containing phosphohydrolase n=1 Tax=Brevibacillus dissolubilis TaxID=1844116 RepID=UPI0011172CB8|nr:HD domain-containing phosphohydrolase [Brevibacillus dissolubilis]